jgi:lipoate-protein ligase B
MMDDLPDFLTPEQLVDMAMCDLAIDIPVVELPDADIKRVMHYIGVWVSQVEKPAIENQKISSLGIGVMLWICLQVFPDYFQKFELWQEN